MIGIFDSGRGAENALMHLRAIAPMADITLLADRENAPYGTKCQDEIEALCRRGIERLIMAGCERVLIACCTASSVYPDLPDDLKRLAVPIIKPTAEEAISVSHLGRIAVIATDATVRSRAFAKHLGNRCAAEIAASPLVCEIENGAEDGAIGDSLGRYLDELLVHIAMCEADTLILGCTHFVCIRREMEQRLKKLTKRKIKTVDSSEVGARHILAIYRAASAGSGVTVRL